MISILENLDAAPSHITKIDLNQGRIRISCTNRQKKEKDK